MPEWFVRPALSPATVDAIRASYGVLLAATLLTALPHARRFFLSERWGGYGQRGPLVDALQNPVVMPLLLAFWLAAAGALAFGRAVVPAALLNVALCHYFFIQMRWRGVLRGMGAPGFITYWLGMAVLWLELTRRHAPGLQGLALLVLQVDFALIMLSAGTYKYFAGYRANNGMELGLVNPEWGRWSVWQRLPPGAWWFRLFNELAWSTEVVAALLMLWPPTRYLGGMLILVSFVFIASQIRLGFLCEMVIVCCLLFVPPGSLVDGWIGARLPHAVPPEASVIAALALPLSTMLWGYLLLLPVARAGLEFTFYAKRALPSPLQSLLEACTNLCGVIMWRVFSADITNFFIEMFELQADGSRRRLSHWGRSLRYAQVAESITVTTLFTTLRYYPSNNALFVERLLRYARTLPGGRPLVFQYVSIHKRPDGFAFVPAAEYHVDAGRRTVTEHVLDRTVVVRAPAAASPVHEGARPGSYAPLGS